MHTKPNKTINDNPFGVLWQYDLDRLNKEKFSSIIKEAITYVQRKHECQVQEISISPVLLNEYADEAKKEITTIPMEIDEMVQINTIILWIPNPPKTGEK